MKAQATKTVTILVRYFIKSSQTVICQVLNGEGKKYFVTLHKNGNTICTCKHGEVAGNKAHCYHVKHVQAIEAARTQPVTPAAPERWCDRCHKQTDEWREQDGEVLCERCIRELERSAGFKEHSAPAATLAGYDVVGAALRVVNDCINAERAGDAYELLAEMRKAVAEVPAYVERFASGAAHTCDLCGRETKSAGVCGACIGY